VNESEAAELIVDKLFPLWENEKERLDHIDKWLRWTQEDMKHPPGATAELKRLAKLSKVPWLSLVVSSLSQCLYVDGFRSGHDPDLPEDEDGALSDRETTGPWRIWMANAMGRRQIAVHRAALAYGYSFVRVVPGVWNGTNMPAMRGVSPRRMVALYEDPAEDDWPELAMTVDARSKGGGWTLSLYDDVDKWTFLMDSSTSKPKYLGLEQHKATVCPFVRFANNLDLDGRCDGEVEPLIALASRINKTAFDRLVTQHFNSWKIRTVAGMAEPETQEEKNQKKLQLAQDRILIGEDPDTRFGTLDETPLGGFVDAWRSDIEALAAVSQTPTHALTGQLINLSAEALAASRAGLTQRVAERQKSFGASHVQALQLAALIDGDEMHAFDPMARVTWQDMEIRSMSQAVDALGKAATLLKVPLEALWARIPGVEKSDVDEWVRMVRQDSSFDRLLAELDRQENTQPVSANQNPPTD
jgi:hypothetical protein